MGALSRPTTGYLSYRASGVIVPLLRGSLGGLVAHGRSSKSDTRINSSAADGNLSDGTIATGVVH